MFVCFFLFFLCVNHNSYCIIPMIVLWFLFLFYSYLLIYFIFIYLFTAFWFIVILGLLAFQEVYFKLMQFLCYNFSRSWILFGGSSLKKKRVFYLYICVIFYNYLLFRTLINKDQFHCVGDFVGDFGRKITTTCGMQVNSVGSWLPVREMVIFFFIFFFLHYAPCALLQLGSIIASSYWMAGSQV